MLEKILIPILISALSCIATIIITQIVYYIKETGKKAKMRKKNELQDIIKETMREEIVPIKEEFQKMKQEQEKDNTLIKAGLQSLIKIDLQKSYDDWIKKGYAPIHIKNELEKLYWVYHNLGRNGVMDSLRDAFNKLPNEKPE